MPRSCGASSTKKIHPPWVSVVDLYLADTIDRPNPIVCTQPVYHFASLRL